MANRDQQSHALTKWFGEKKTVRLMLLAALLTLGVIHFQWLLAGALFLWKVASPLLWGLVLAYILEIVISRLEAILFPGTKKKWLAGSRRWIAILIAAAVLASILSFILFTVLPGLADAVTLLARELPVYFAQFKQWAMEAFRSVPAITEPLSALEFDWPSIQQRLVDWAVQGMGSRSLLSSTVTVISTVTGRLTDILIALIFAVFLLGSKTRLTRQANRLLRVSLSEKNEARVRAVLAAANRCFSGYIIGQTLNGLILGALTWLGMRLFRMPYALTVAVLIGTASLIPILGGYIGAALGTFLVFTAAPEMALWFLLFIAALQTVTGNTLYPRLMGSSVGMPSIWVLASITLGGGLGGILGMLAAVPVTATLYAIVRQWVRRAEKEKEAARLNL